MPDCQSTGGIIALAEQKQHHLSLPITHYAACARGRSCREAWQPGAILRAADAAGLDAVVIFDPQTDFYNPNVIRSSVRCVFTNQVASATSGQTLLWLKSQYRGFIAPTFRPHNLTRLISPGPARSSWARKPRAIGYLGEEQRRQYHYSDAGKIDSVTFPPAAAVVVFAGQTTAWIRSDKIFSAARLAFVKST